MLDDLMRDAMRGIQDAAEQEVEKYLRLHFGIEQKISVHAPWWMPQWLYRRLMRSILIQQAPLRIERKK